MPQFVAPGVYVVERDFSDYVAALQATSLGMVGTAKKGPLNEATLCTTPEQFISIFGEPSPNNTYGPIAALNYLRRGNQLWYVRVAKEYAKDASLLGAAATKGSNQITLTAGHPFVIGSAIRVRQTGRSTSIAKVTAVSTNTLTLDGQLIDSYSTSASSDSSVDIATGTDPTTAANQAEVFGYTRKGGASTPVVKFTAKDPGKWANFGTKNGIEVVIEDSGTFKNANPVTGEVYESTGGVPLEGIVTTAASVDTKAELLALTTADVRNKELRGVNYDSLIYSVTNVAVATNVATLTLSSVEGLNVGDTLQVAAVTNATVNGTAVITAVNAGAKTVTYAKTTADISTVADTGKVEKTSGEHMGVVYEATVSGSTITWVAKGLLTKRVKVFYQGRQVEVFDNIVAYDPSAPNYWDNVVGSASGTSVSNYIYAEYLGNTGEQPICTYSKSKHPYNPRLLMGVQSSVRVSASGSAAVETFQNAAGQDGESPTSSEYIGLVREDGTRTGLQIFRQTGEFDINLISVPAVTLPEVINEILSVVEDRNDCLAVLDTPFALTVQEAVDWHNGTGPYSGQHSAFVSNKAAMYYPWVQIFDPYTSREVWVPPSAVVPGVIAHSDSVSDVWFAPAGLERGHVFDAIKVEHRVSDGEVEVMYGPGNGNALNPIRQFTRDGITVFGQRTLQRVPTALDRINVRRMMFFIEKSIATSVRKLVFQQDDPILWNRFKALVTPFLKSMVGRRAIEDFRVVCDASTNPPDRRNNNEMGAKLLVIPVKSAEKIVLDFTLLPSGANFNEFIEQA